MSRRSACGRRIATARAGADRDARVAHDAVLRRRARPRPCDGDDEIAPRAKFQEGRAHRWRRLGADDRASRISSGREHGAAGARDEISRAEGGARRARDELDLGVERQQGRDAIGGGRGVAEIAGDRAAVLDLDRADLARRGLQRVESGRQIGMRPDRSRSSLRRCETPPPRRVTPRSSATLEISIILPVRAALAGGGTICRCRPPASAPVRSTAPGSPLSAMGEQTRRRAPQFVNDDVSYVYK